MNFKPLCLDDKPIFDRYYEQHPQYSSYLSFATLYTWRRFTKLRFAVEEGEIIMEFTHSENGKDYYFLPQTTRESMKKAIELLRREEKELKIYNMTKSQAEILSELFPGEFEIIHNRDGDNYYYLTEDLISLKGKKLHSKRNFVNRFKKEYQYEYVKINDSLAAECIQVAKDWCERKNCNADKGMEHELSACEEALSLMKELNLKGGAIRIEGKIIAFSVGEKMNGDTALIHFEKADTDFSGIFPLINNEFVKNEWEATTYVNREEDMGLPGLRKSKLSYYPVFMLETYIVHENKASGSFGLS